MYPSFDKLPFEVLINIAKFFDNAKDLASFGSLNQKCRQACEDHTVWRQLTMDKFHGIISFAGENCDWKELYRFNHYVLYDVLYRQQQQQIYQMDLSRGPLTLNLPVENM
eukprot:TRINITY_DN21462_c1_g1_i1.p4 TRINITY_DN21462_c1_g1~~TRINITY_DN21462_c1_g1_i1.p4  ORF type:complete len:110 (+),score=7.93 TRINITY_DN21462_c1_g1_i1:141-470(+)